MLDVHHQHQIFRPDRPDSGGSYHGQYESRPDNSGRLGSTPSPSPEMQGMVVSEPVPTQVAHWTGGQPFTGYVQDFAIMPNVQKYPPPVQEPSPQKTPRKKRERLNYTRYQLEVLNYIYKYIRYPNNAQKELIAKRVGISRHQAKIWFQNRRRKDVMNIPTQDTPDDKLMVPEAVKKGVLTELMKHKDDPQSPKTPTFRAEPRPYPMVNRPDLHSPGHQTHPMDAQSSPGPVFPNDHHLAPASPATSDSSVQILNPGSPLDLISRHKIPAHAPDDSYSDINSEPGSPAPYSPQMNNINTNPSMRQFADHSNPGSPYSPTVLPVSPGRGEEETAERPLENRAKDLRKDTFFAYNDGSCIYPAGANVPANMARLPAGFPPQMRFAPPHGNGLVPQNTDAPRSKDVSPKAGLGAPSQPGFDLPGYQELMNYKQTTEDRQNKQPFGAQSDDLASHRSASEAGSEHGDIPENPHPQPAHQPHPFNLGRVFPFPFYAEPPMPLAAMPNQHLQYPPWAYQAQAIQAAHNPFYGFYPDMGVVKVEPPAEHEDGEEGGASKDDTLTEL